MLIVDYYTVNIHSLLLNLYDFPAPLILDLAMWLASANRMWAKMTTEQFQAQAFRSFPCFHLSPPLPRKEQSPGRFCFSRMGSRMRHMEQTWIWPSALFLQVAPEHTQHSTDITSSKKSHHHYLENCRGGRCSGEERRPSRALKGHATSADCRPMSRK